MCAQVCASHRKYAAAYNPVAQRVNGKIRGWRFGSGPCAHLKEVALAPLNGDDCAYMRYLLASRRARLFNLAALVLSDGVPTLRPLLEGLLLLTSFDFAQAPFAGLLMQVRSRFAASNACSVATFIFLLLMPCLFACAGFGVVCRPHAVSS